MGKMVVKQPNQPTISPPGSDGMMMTRRLEIRPGNVKQDMVENDVLLAVMQIYHGFKREFHDFFEEIPWIL